MFPAANFLDWSYQSAKACSVFVGDNAEVLFPKASVEAPNQNRSSSSTTVNRQKTQSIAAGGMTGSSPRVRRDVGYPHAVAVDAPPSHELDSTHSDHPPHVAVSGQLDLTKHEPSNPRVTFVIPPEEVFLRLPKFHQNPSPHRSIRHSQDYPVFSYGQDEYEFVKLNREEETARKLTTPHAAAVTLTDNSIPEEGKLLMNESDSRESSAPVDNQSTTFEDGMSTTLSTSVSEVYTPPSFFTVRSPPTVPGVLIGGQCECSCPCLDPAYKEPMFWYDELTSSTLAETEISPLTAETQSSVFSSEAVTGISSESTILDTTEEQSTTEDEKTTSEGLEQFTTEKVIAEVSETEDVSSTVENPTTFEPSPLVTTSDTDLPIFSSTAFISSVESTFSPSSTTSEVSESLSEMIETMTEEEEVSTTAASEAPELTCTVPPPMILVLEGETVSLVFSITFFYLREN